MQDPIAFFLTWVTYGTWLPGDARGWIDYKGGWQEPDRSQERNALFQMTENACQLSPEQRQIVEKQVQETCNFRTWTLHAVNCRSNHIHVVVSAIDVKPEKIRNDLKSWTTRVLKKCSNTNRDKWWAERGSIRYLYDEDSLFNAVQYTLEAQERKRD
ncbi:transposase [Rubinisphaera italica]|uniref:Transposase IS200 like protein n=1 Tax=Rubinisphaera italica TaxID=2527969 RepID=A0A5C5XJX5_9PLAN|nr:transposase [Rubinisphaera italica]TWT62425.1 Transposase IS200 like protein [Rubinisphaera italica]